MPNRAINGQSVENLVLLGIPKKEFSILAPHVDHVGLENGAILEREGARIGEVHFLNRVLLCPSLAIGPEASTSVMSGRPDDEYSTFESSWFSRLVEKQDEAA